MKYTKYTGYPKLKWVDTATEEEQLEQVKEEFAELLEVMQGSVEIKVEEAHDLCQSVTTLIRIICKNNSLNYQKTVKKCVEKGISRNGKRSERHGE